MSTDDPGGDAAYCPRCGAEVYLYANRCPQCGDYITPTLQRKGRRIWLAIIAIITLAAFLYLMLFR